MIGSHNTLTYMKPLKWWMYVTIPFARCQKSSLEKQQDYDVTLADIRVKFYKGVPYVSHGIARYCTLDEAIKLFQEHGITKVRLLIEGNPTDAEIVILYCIMKKASNIEFYTGRHKKTWVKLLDLPDIEVIQIVGSMQSWYGKILPWLWHKLNKQQCKTWYNVSLHKTTYTLFDFI